MKKFLGLLISSLAIISLVSCKNPKQSSDSSIETETYYHVSFLNYDDTLLYEVDVLKGETAEYKGETPVKEEDDEFTYEFSGWDKELSNVLSNFTTKAVFKETAKENWGPIIWF